MSNKKFSIVMYCLSAIFLLILSIFVYRVITHIYYYIPYSEVTLSQYTGERVEQCSLSNPTKVATYINTNTTACIEGLSSADIVLEFLNSSGVFSYKAIFQKDFPKSISPVINVKEYSNCYLPVLNFMDSIDIPNTWHRTASSIFINFNEETSSNFLYKKGQYYHYRGLDIDKDNNVPIKISNVLVQFIDGTIKDDESLTYNKNSGTGLLFCGGKALDIKWTREKANPIKITDGKGGEISLMPGQTWWVLIDKNCSVAYD